MSGTKFFLKYTKSAVLSSLRRSNNTTIRCMSSTTTKDVETHTGQQWAEDDYRLVRFVDKPKHVNPNWGIKLIDEVPPKACTERVVWCDGGGGPTGHPKVYINLDKPGNHACGYCGLRFYLDHSHSH